MTQLERKCLVASTSVHAGLALILVIAPLIWVAQKHPELTVSVMTFVPSRLTDGASSGGGSPRAKTMPPPAAGPVANTPLTLAPPTPVPPAPAPPKPKTVASKPEKAVVKVETEAPPKTKRPTGEPVPSEKKTEDISEADEPKPTKHKIAISLDRDTSRSKETKQAKEAREAKESKEAAAAEARTAARAQARYASGVNSVLASLAQGVSSSTSVDVPGPGGEAVGNYSQWVVSVYHRAWSPPSDLADPLATVTVQVVILRNGKVDSFKIIKHSGHAALDRSVQRLGNVEFIAPFPDGATNERRTFIIDFNLRSKNS